MTARPKPYIVVDPDGTTTRYEFGGPAREHADRTGGDMHFYQCWRCGEDTDTLPPIAHRGRCFPDWTRPELAPATDVQLDLFSGAT